MEDERIVASGFSVTPDAIAGRSFTSAFRGFDQSEVRAFLKRVSEELAAAAEREAQLRRLLQEAQNKAAHPELDEALLTNALGEQAARLLGSAREQAASIRTEAEAKANRLMRDAEAQISRVRSEADGLLARRVEEVDGVTANLRNAAEADARALREQARADVEAELLAARTQGREMVAEARAVRERILADLARRRHIAEVQLDQLRAARERLLAAYALVRRTLDEATQELKMAEVEARLAAEEVGRRAPDPPPMPAAPEPATAVAARAAAAAAAPSRLAAATAVRPPRPEPPRPEPRLRPPGRPDDTRPTMPIRRVEDAPPPRPEPAVAVGQTPLAAAAAGAGAEALARPPAPAAAPPHRTSMSPPAPVPPAPVPPVPPPVARQTPAILPRPVPPPPARAARPDLAPPSPAPEPPPSEADRVDELFARIKADRAATAAAALAPAEPLSAPPATPTAPVPPLPVAAVVPPAAPLPAPEPAPAPARSEIADESARNRRDELLDPVEETLARQLKRVLQDEQNEVLDRLRRRRRRHGGSPLLDAEEQIGRFREAAESVLADAVRTGVRFADASASEAHADEGAAREIANAIAVEVARPLRERLERAVSDPDIDGNGDRDRNPEISEALSAVYRQWRAQELEPLARHHAVVAFSRGAYAAYADGTQLVWVVDDEVPCPDCDDNTLAGAVVKGDAFPTGQLHPPAHPGCRCLLVPAVP